NRFVRFLGGSGRPAPRLNTGVEAGGRWCEVDCLWRAQRLVVELDGRRFHSSRFAFERDRARDRALNAAGWRVVRITWHQLDDDPERLAADLRTLLASGLEKRGPRYPDRP